MSVIQPARLATCVSLLFYFFLSGCQTARTDSTVSGPAIEFTSVPVTGRGDSGKVSTIKGRAIGARPGQQIVLYALANDDDGQMTWFVQPLVNEPFTRIRSGSRWSNSTHPGSEYAALLVEPGFQPPRKTRMLPTQGVIAVAVTQGWPPVWQRWWFPLACVVVVAVGTFGFYCIWLYQVTRKLKLRFEERLAERTRVAQELHDTLLQGVLSASMQLHIAVDQLAPNSPLHTSLNHVLQLMAQVVDEGRNTVRGLRSTTASARDLEQSFSRIPQELSLQQEVGFRIIVEGPAMPLQSAIYDEVYKIGREALVNAFRHSQARSIEVELEYTPSQLRVVVRDDGCGIDAAVLRLGRDGHWGLSGMRERAERMGARLKVLSSAASGTEVELRVPSRVAFESHPTNRVSKWFERLSGEHRATAESELTKRGKINERTG